VNLRLLDDVLVKVSNMIVDFPEIKELDINPLVICGDNTVALDARIVLDEETVKHGVEEYSHLIISPYPTRYVEPWECSDGTPVILRPIRPEDEQMESDLITGLSQESNRYRFFKSAVRDLTHEELTRFCNIDYEREMAIIAEYGNGGKKRNVGVARLVLDASKESGEFAILVADDFHGKGLGLKLSDKIIGIALEKKLKSIYGIVLNDNRKMISLGRKLGFTLQHRSAEDSILFLDLQ